jgi:HSP20 family molecular chaperone IbpA
MYFLNRTDNLFDDFFDDLFKEPFFTENRETMKTDIRELDNQYLLEVELPGFHKEEITIDMKDGYLNVTAKRQKADDDKNRLIRNERFYGEMSRSYYVGNYTENEINAKYQDGILSIAFPKNSLTDTKKYIAIE